MNPKTTDKTHAATTSRQAAFISRETAPTLWGIRPGLLLAACLMAAFNAHGAGLGPIFPIQAIGAQQLALRPDGTAAIADVSFLWIASHTYLHDALVSQIAFGETDQSSFQGYSPPFGGPLYSPDVAVNATNGVIVYSDLYETVSDEGAIFTVSLFRFDTNGTPTTAISNVTEIALSRNSSYLPVRTDMNRAGRFAVVYFSETAKFQLPLFEEYIYAQLFNADGTSVAPAFVVNQRLIAYWPVVAVTPDGGAIAVWEDASVGGGSYDPGHDIYARRIDANGNPMGNEFRVNTTINGRRNDAEIAIATNGSFAIVWTQSLSDADGVYLQRFNADGSRLGPELRVSPYNGLDPQVTMIPDGRFIVAWRGQDGNGSGIFAQRFLADGSFYGSALWTSEGATNSQTTPLLGLADDGTFIVKCMEATNHFARWIAWDATNQTQILGPRVQSLSPAVPAAPLANVTVTFDRSMSPATFATADAQLIDPLGRVIPVLSVQTTNHRVFTLSFAPQQLAGRYHITISPTIQDANGALMDENGNTIGGESADAYLGQFTLTSSATAGFPVTEGFESDPDSLAGWSFDSAIAGRLVLSMNNAPHAGTNHLNFIGGPIESATLAVNLSGQAGQTNLFLAFWGRQNYYFIQVGDFHVELSGDGQTWHPIPVTDPSANYTEYVVDLDQAAATNGVSLDGDVYIRFLFDFNSSGLSLYLDDVRVTAGELPIGPKVLGLNPTQWAATNATLNAATVTFDQPIDPATFTGADVALNSAQGFTVSNVTVLPVADSGNTQFTLTFPDQTVRGVYQLTIGPDIAGASGHLMNQNGNAANGEPTDIYVGTVTFVPAAAPNEPGPIVFEETFECWPPAPSNWSFQLFPSGAVGLSAFSPRRGTNHLVIGADGGDTSAGSHSAMATLALDLSGLIGQTNLFLDFWAKDGAPWTSLFYVDISNDSQTWQQILYAAPPGSYTQYTLDLDQTLAVNGISLTQPVYIRFRSTVSVSPYSQVGQPIYLDDIRILAGDPSALIPPAITNQPQSVHAGPGSNVTFTVSAMGTGPLSYQWLFNGAVIAGATDATLSLTDVQPANGGDYRVVVSNPYGQEVSSFAILGGVNDHFTDRIVMSGVAATVRGLNANATRDPGEPNYAYSSKSVWWSWTAPRTGRVVISTVGSNFDTMLRIFTGDSVSNLTSVASDDNSGGNYTSQVTFLASQGVEYLIDVEGVSGAAGSITLNLQLNTTSLSQPSRLPDGQFRFDLSGPAGNTYVIQASTDLSSWASIATSSIPAEGFITVTDPSATNYTHRFYRAMSQ